MPHLLVSLMLFLSGIAAYAMVQNLVIGLHKPRSRAHLLFALLCLETILFTLFRVESATATDAASYLVNTRYEVDVIGLFLLSFPWFVAEYTGIRPVRLLWLLSFDFLLALAANQTAPFTIQFARFNGIRITRLPWGEQLTHGIGQPGGWMVFVVINLLLLLTYCGRALYLHHQRHQKIHSMWLQAAFYLFLLNIIWGTLNRLGIVHGLILGPIPFELVIATMAAVYSHETLQKLRQSENTIRSILEHSATAIIAFNPDRGDITSANSSALRLTGLDAMVVHTLNIRQILHPDDLSRFESEMENLRSGQMDAVHCECHIRHASGSYHTADSHFSPLFNGSGTNTEIILNMTDISDRKRAEIALKTSETRFRNLFERSPMGISLSQDGRILDVNQAFLFMFGYQNAAELHGVSVLDLVSPNWRKQVSDIMAQRRQPNHEDSSYETRCVRKDGREFPVFIATRRIDTEAIPLTIAYLIDFTERFEAAARIQNLVMFDQLTQLPNRQLLHDRLQHALLGSTRNHLYGAILLIDLDNFKTINDTLGHPVGDALLQRVADLLRHLFSESATIARLGSDEFVLILEGLSGKRQEAASITEAASNRITHQISQPQPVGDQVIRTSASIGATLFFSNDIPADVLMRHADIALHQAKTDGRNAMRFFDQRMQEHLSERASLESDLHRAIAAGEFELHYQVQVDEHDQPVGAEALIRWQHPELGMISPAQFIPLAEETGLILALGDWIIDNACTRLKLWQNSPVTASLQLAINVSSVQFQRGDLAGSLRACLQRHAINPERLKLELTESLLLQDIESSVGIMQSIKAMGIRFSLDDFGTGYSSLQYLRRLPLDQLKIDRSFVSCLTETNHDHTIVRTIIAMANSLGLDVIAEGVETIEQRQILLDSGCRHFQGYLYGRPLPVVEFEARLHRATQPEMDDPS